ncbi:DUF6300 family protein [Streptomyces sp. NBC_01235]|uniref:DUF6300 family protein n=1 Tax=Streptomyces sp. NBC_01235 TaxID=2903788 RepID=UPI002E126892|nr:DUF6300 family protein [Streptomyces sp. NBC_01235]
MSGVAPQDDEHGRPIHLELCPVCDTGDVNRPAAGLLVQRFANDGGHDESRVKEGSHLLMEWTKECMAAHGWCLPQAGVVVVLAHRHDRPGRRCPLAGVPPQIRS